MRVDDQVRPGGAEGGEIPAALAMKRRLEGDDEFCFGCHSGLPCFNTCCRDVNIILTPVDVLTLSRNLEMTTTDFIEQHTLKPITKDLKLPVLLLKMSDTDEKRCPFVGDEGCTVYDARPWSCRMYPVAVAVPPARAGEEPKAQHFLLEDDFCAGHNEQKSWTVDAWRQNQGVAEREALEEGFRQIHSHPWFIGGVRQLNPAGMEMFFLASYDLDAFRRFILDTTFTKRFEIEEELVGKLRTNDDELIRFGSRWLRYALFAEPTVKVRADAPTAGRSR